jgi:hypothetical protein
MFGSMIYLICCRGISDQRCRQIVCRRRAAAALSLVLISLGTTMRASGILILAYMPYLSILTVPTLTPFNDDVSYLLQTVSSTGVMVVKECTY